MRGQRVAALEDFRLGVAAMLLWIVALGMRWAGEPMRDVVKCANGGHGGCSCGFCCTCRVCAVCRAVIRRVYRM